MTQILSWNSRLVPHDLYELDSDLEYLQWREKFFQRIFLHTPGPIDVGYSLHKIEVQRNPLLLFQCLIFNIREIMSLQLLNSRKEPFFSETAVAMADIIANTLMVVLLYVLWIDWNSNWIVAGESVPAGSSPWFHLLPCFLALAGCQQ